MLDGTPLHVDDQEDERPTMAASALERLHEKWELHQRGPDPYTIYKEVPDESAEVTRRTHEATQATGIVAVRGSASPEVPRTPESSPLEAGTLADPGFIAAEASDEDEIVGGNEASSKSAPHLAKLRYARELEAHDESGESAKVVEDAWRRFDNGINGFVERNSYSALAGLDPEVTHAFITRYMEVPSRRRIAEDLLKALPSLDSESIKLFIDLYDSLHGEGSSDRELPVWFLKAINGVEDGPDIANPDVVIVDEFGRAVSVIVDGEIVGAHELPDEEIPEEEPNDDESTAGTHL